MEQTRRVFVSGAGATLLLGALAGCLGGDDDDANAVASEPFDDIGVAEFEVLDRSEDPAEVTAYVHDDHWHGEIPNVPVDDTVSLGATVFDEDGEALELGDAFELRVAEAAEADTDVLSFDYHGDHVHLVGEETGVTEIVFLLWHDDHADYQSEPIAVQVV